MLARFLREVRSALPEGVILSLELPSETVRAGYDTDAGQALSALAPVFSFLGEPFVALLIAGGPRLCPHHGGGGPGSGDGG